MIKSDSNSACSQALPHYYDYICGEAKELTPGKILEHINRCGHCQDEINRLKDELAKKNNYGEHKHIETDSVIISSLKLHFAYIDRHVNCHTVRPFLPALSIRDLEIRIPTPITAHIDNCPACSNDLETIKSLGLTHTQLHLLTQLLSGELHTDSASCSEAKKSISSVASMNFKGTSTGILRHLSSCSDCRELLYKAREIMYRASLDKPPSSKFYCEKIGPAEIIDYVVPCSIDPEDEEYADFRKSMVSHLRDCPVCLEKIQDLHNTVYDIVVRNESGIMTCFHVDESARDVSQPDPNELYDDWPVKVEVFPPKPKLKVSTPILKRLIKPLAAAAIIIIVLSLFFTTTSAQAIDLSQIHQALQKITNIYITMFTPSQKEPVNEIWVSRTSNIYMSKAENRLFLWDIDKGIRKTRLQSTGMVEETKVEEDNLVRLKNRIDSSLGLLPFANISEAPKNVQWQQVTNAETGNEFPGTVVYELIWTDKSYSGSLQCKKWRAYLNPDTNLLKKAEWYGRTTEDDKYILESFVVVAYPHEDEIRVVIRDTFF